MDRLSVANTRQFRFGAVPVGRSIFEVKPPWFRSKRAIFLPIIRLGKVFGPKIFFTPTLVDRQGSQRTAIAKQLWRATGARGHFLNCLAVAFTGQGAG